MVALKEIVVSTTELPPFLQPGVLQRPVLSEAERQSLKGQVVVAPGGSRGIGRAFIRKVTEYGASVVTGRRNSIPKRRAEMDDVVAEIEAGGVLVRVVYGDLRDAGVQRAYVQAARELMGELRVETVHTIYSGPAAGAASLTEDAEEYARKLNTVVPAQFVSSFRQNGIGVGGVAYPASTMSYGYGRSLMPLQYVPVAQYKHEGVKKLAETEVPLYIACGHAVKGTMVIDTGLKLLKKSYPGFTEALADTSIGGRFATVEDMADALIASRLSGSSRVVFAMGEGEWGYAPARWEEEYFRFLNQQFAKFGFPMPGNQET